MKTVRYTIPLEQRLNKTDIESTNLQAIDNILNLVKIFSGRILAIYRLYIYIVKRFIGKIYSSQNFHKIPIQLNRSIIIMFNRLQ